MTNLADRIAADEFIRTEHHAARRLALLTNGSIDLEEAAAWMRVYTLEATYCFEDDGRAKFRTFLYSYLQNRCRALWRKNSRSPKHQRVVAEPSSEDPETLEVTELLSQVSQPTRQAFTIILNSGDFSAQFRKRVYKSTVSRDVNLSKEEIESMVQELRKKIPDHLSAINEW